MRKLMERIQRERKNDDGMALLSTIGLMMFVFTVVIALMMSTLVSAKVSSDTRSDEASVSSSDSALDTALQAATVGTCQPTGSSSAYGYTFKVFRSANTVAPTSTTQSGVSAGCPQTGDTYMVVDATGKNARGKDTHVVAVYKWVKATNNGVDGAITAGSSSSGLANYSVLSGEGADMVILNGAFSCANNVRVDGDLIVLTGGLTLSNSCAVKGNVYANGKISIPNGVTLSGSVYANGGITMSNTANIAGSVIATGTVELSNSTTIGGDLYVGGDLKAVGPQIKGNAYVKGALNLTGSAPSYTHFYKNLISTSVANSSVSAQVDGDIYTAGSLTLGTSSVVGGSVYSSGTNAVTYYNVKVNGDLYVNGSFSSLQSSTIGGVVKAVAKGRVNAIAPDVTAKSIYLGGTLSTWSTGPKANPIVQNTTLTNAPTQTFTVPETTKPSRPWRDYSYLESDWTDAGYTITKPTVCDYQNSASAVAQVNNLTSPTVIDLRGCSSINMYGVTFNTKTNVTFLGNKFDSMSQVRLNSADAKPHNFYVITSDTTANSTPTCGTGQGTLSMYGLRSDAYIQSFFYSPCNIQFGGNGFINGQLYGGNFLDGATSTIQYKRLPVPGFPTDVVPSDTYFDTNAKTRPAPRLVGRTEL